MTNPVSEAVGGFGLLLRGFGLVVRRPRNFALGAIPPAITSVLFVVVLSVLIARIGPIVQWLTPFARRWPEGAEQAVEIAIGVALVGAVILLMVVTFTAITLAIGGPIYDKIGEYVEAELGPDQSGTIPAYEEPVLPGIGRSIRQSLGIIAVSALGALPLFLAGFLPVVGQTVVPVVSAMFGGWLLAIELLAGPFVRRGMPTIAARRTAMRTTRFRVWGFAAPTFALLAIPFVAIVVFPAAAAGSVLLARQLLDPQESKPKSASPRPSARS